MFSPLLSVEPLLEMCLGVMLLWLDSYRILLTGNVTHAIRETKQLQTSLYFFFIQAMQIFQYICVLFVIMTLCLVPVNCQNCEDGTRRRHNKVFHIKDMSLPLR